MRNQGMVLIASLVVITVLLTIGIAQLFSVEHSYWTVGKIQMGEEAYYLALSGIRYYRIKSSAFRPGVPQTRAVPLNDSSHFFEVSIDDVNSIHSRGYIRDTQSRIIAERVLIVPKGRWMDLYDDRL